MISFNLVCGNGHGFEGWFRSGKAFEDQAAQGVLECPVCSSNQVSKGVMAPAIARGVTRRDGDGTRREEPQGKPPAASEPQAAKVDPRHVGQLLQLMRKIHDHVEKNFENVGDRFVREARAIHAGEAERRDIYGQATIEDATALNEEGIVVVPLPSLPKLDS
ncbi:MAG: DUF1178 family protein [Geminicoccaceae bacterium]|mgnify:CR=1 FL=1|nr:DUF1178 family protein [Geminicoccaceae bacterium]MCB9944066.1 DUF1178 family protein [Geminicoccaceae bacterium]